MSCHDIYEVVVECGLVIKVS